jgi:hypothetical protein
MALDPANPPIWLRKLHLMAAQIDPSDYAPTPEEGILRVCRLSDDMYMLSKAFADALGLRLGLQGELHYVLQAAGGKGDR